MNESNLIKCSFVEFHSDVFCKGKNFGKKINSTNDVKLYYNVPLRLMFMEYLGMTAFFETFHTAIPEKETEKPASTKKPAKSQAE